MPSVNGGCCALEPEKSVGRRFSRDFTFTTAVGLSVNCEKSQFSSSLGWSFRFAKPSQANSVVFMYLPKRLLHHVTSITRCF